MPTLTHHLQHISGKDHDRRNGRTTNLLSELEAEQTPVRFSDEINGLAGVEEELAKLVERLDKASTAYGMEISADKTKLMTTPKASTRRSK